MSDHAIPIRREFKYLVPRAELPVLRRILEPLCELDSHAGPDGTYALRSLYLDGPGLPLYKANEREDNVRFKARIRSYPESPGSPIFAEIKARSGDVIRKTRAALSPDEWTEAITGRGGTPSPALDEFVGRWHRYGLQPMTLVQYRREAWMGLYDAYARVSIDTRIECARAWSLDVEPAESWRPVDDPIRSITPGSICVVELKWAEVIPQWMIVLVQHLEYLRHSFSKYCYAMLTLGEEHYRDYRRAESPWS